MLNMKNYCKYLYINIIHISSKKSTIRFIKNSSKCEQKQQIGADLLSYTFTFSVFLGRPPRRPLSFEALRFLKLFERPPIRPASDTLTVV